MEHSTVVEPAGPLTPAPPQGMLTSDDERAGISLLGPFVFGAACGWILLSFVNLGELAFGLTRNIQLANALWLAYLQPALLLLVTGAAAVLSVVRNRAASSDSVQGGRLRIVRLALALLIAWAPYLILFALPHGILRLDTYQEASQPETQAILMFVQNALAPTVGWLTGLLAVFVWGRPARSGPGRPLASMLARWLAVALVASTALAFCAQLNLLSGRVVDIFLIAPIDPTCGGGCTSDFIVNRLLLPLALAIVFGALGGIVGGYLRFGRTLLRATGVRPEREDLPIVPPGGDLPASPQPIAHAHYRTLPGSAYWGPFLLGLLVCGGWLLALNLSLGVPLAAPLWRIPAQIALLLVLPAGVVVYAGWRRRRSGVLLPRQAIYALLVVAASLAGLVVGVIGLAGPSAGALLLLPLFSPIFLPPFEPVLSIGVAVGFGWGIRPPDARHPVARAGGVIPALCGWLGFVLPLAGFMVLELVAVQSHSITCGNFGGCVLAAVYTLSAFELLATLILFGLALIMAGLAIGRTLARRVPPPAPRPAITAHTDRT